MTLELFRTPDRCEKRTGKAGRKTGFARALLAAATLAACVSGTGSAQAQDFESLAGRLADHPSVTALRAQAEGSDDLARAARGLPDPVLTLGINNIPVNDPAFDRFLPSNKSVGVEQAIPNPGVRRARSAQQRVRSRRFTLQAEYRIALLRAQLIAALAEKAKAVRQLELAQKQLELYGEMERLLRGELEAGRPVYFRLSEIDVERAEVDRRLTELRNELVRIDAELVQLVGEAASVVPPETPLDRWGGEPLALYPVLLAETGIGLAEAGVRESRAEYGPDFGVRLQYQQREDGVSGGGMPFEGDDWFSAGVAVSVPLWAAQNQAPRLRAARAQEAAAKASFHAALREARQRLSALYSTHESALRNIEILKAKENSLRELIGAALRNYEAGRGTYIQILDGEAGLLTLRAQIEGEQARALATAARANSYLVPK